MQDFIKLATTALGTTEETTRKATAGLLELMSKVAPAADFQALVSRLPGAGDLLKAFFPEQAPPPPPPAPPPSTAAAMLDGLGDFVTNAATAVQGTVGAGLALGGLLAQVGFDPHKARQFVVMFVDFARATAGRDTVDRVIDAVPGLRQLLP